METMTNWEFWSMLIALGALILSIFPYLRSFFSKAKLDFEIYSRIFITHKVGYPNLQMNIILYNTGWKNIRIKRINLKLYRDDKEILTLPALTYIPEIKDNRSVLLTHINIEPQKEWNHITNFHNHFDRTEEKFYKDAEINLLNEIQRLREETDNNINKAVKVGDEFIKPFEKIFKDNFIWEEGEYKIIIDLETNYSNINLNKNCRFTIFESQSKFLKKHLEYYFSGDGILFETKSVEGIFI